MSLLGELIDKLGVNPRYLRTNREYWSGGNVLYGSNTCEKLKMDIEAEKAAISGYQRVMHEIPNQSIRALIQRIIGDEEVHLKLFNEAVLCFC
jgi:bacterioferritin